MRTISLSFLLLPFFLCGCVAATGSRMSPAAEGEENLPAALAVARQELKFDDVPVPAGFKLLLDRSFVFQTEETRVALLKYIGRANLPALINFYKEQMPIYNWALINIVEYEKSVLNFERDKQSCLINIELKGAKKIITISLSPKNPLPAIKSQHK